MSCQLHELFLLVKTLVGWSGTGILLSSATSDNLLLFLTAEGPDIDLLAGVPFPKVQCLRPSYLRNGNLFRAQVRASLSTPGHDPAGGQGHPAAVTSSTSAFTFPTAPTANDLATQAPHLPLTHGWPTQVTIPVYSLCFSADNTQPRAPPWMDINPRLLV